MSDECSRDRDCRGGASAAIELRQRGVDVICVGKRRRDDAHTVLAAGGINAALGTMDPQDTWEQHAADTLREAYGLADPTTVEILAREALGAIHELVDWGATFQTEADGRLSQRFFGAHRFGGPASPATTRECRHRYDLRVARVARGTGDLRLCARLAGGRLARLRPGRRS